MHYLSPDDIIVPPDRQRKEFKIKDLIESIRRFGIINPIVVTSDNELIAGERRLRAARELGLDVVPVRYLEDLDPTERKVIELEENISRVDLTWQEEVDAVREIWELSGKPIRRELAEYLGRSEFWVRQRLKLAEEIERRPELKEADTMDRAKRLAEKLNRREVLDNVSLAISDVSELHEVRQADFTLWAATAEEQFNFIHVDFPYGVNLDKSGIKGRQDKKVYDDSEGTYWTLTEAFFRHLDNFATEDCIVMWWLSLKQWNRTVEVFESAGFEVWYNPLVWAYGANVGITAYPDKWPRHSYETALIARRGNIPLANNRWDCTVFNPQTIDRIHPSEKPYEMLEHFFQLFIDKHTTMLDPTCGSGSSILVARDLKAQRALGLELDPEYAALAQRRLK